MYMYIHMKCFPSTLMNQGELCPGMSCNDTCILRTAWICKRGGIRLEESRSFAEMHNNGRLHRTEGTDTVCGQNIFRLWTARMLSGQHTCSTDSKRVVAQAVQRAHVLGQHVCCQGCMCCLDRTCAFLTAHRRSEHQACCFGITVLTAYAVQIAHVLPKSTWAVQAAHDIHM